MQGITHPAHFVSASYPPNGLRGHRWQLAAQISCLGQGRVPVLRPGPSCRLAWQAPPGAPTGINHRRAARVSPGAVEGVVFVGSTLGLCVDRAQAARADRGFLAVLLVGSAARSDREPSHRLGVYDHVTGPGAKWVGDGDVLVAQGADVHALVQESLAAVSDVAGTAIAHFAAHGAAVAEPVARLSIARIQRALHAVVSGNRAGTTDLCEVFCIEPHHPREGTVLGLVFVVARVSPVGPRRELAVVGVPRLGECHGPVASGQLR